MPAIKPMQSLQPGRLQNRAEETYARILDMISTGVLPRGTFLLERALAEELGVSRTPVREALTRLESEGLAMRVGRGQLVVKEPAIREYIEILHLRQIIESEAAMVAAQNLPIEEADALIHAVRGLLARKPYRSAEQLRIDDLIHDSIARASGNQHLAKLVNDLRLRTRIFDLHKMPHRLEVGGKEHIELLTCIKRRDGEGARRAMRQHLENVKRSIVERLTQF